MGRKVRIDYNQYDYKGENPEPKSVIVSEGEEYFDLIFTWWISPYKSNRKIFKITHILEDGKEEEQSCAVVAMDARAILSVALDVENIPQYFSKIFEEGLVEVDNTRSDDRKAKFRLGQ